MKNLKGLNVPKVKANAQPYGRVLEGGGLAICGLKTLVEEPSCNSHMHFEPEQRGTLVSRAEDNVDSFPQPASRMKK